MEIDDFLHSIGMGNEEEKSTEPSAHWHDILRPSKVGVMLGMTGSGKSGLGYYLLEHLSSKYSLIPVVVNLPREKRALIPESWVISSLREMQRIESACVLIDEGTTTLPTGGKLEMMMKSFASLARQRDQIILYIFHASSDVGSRILRGVAVVLLKEPSKRQIEFGSKDNWMRMLLEEAKDRFKAIRDIGADSREFTYVDSEDPEFRGVVKNPLCSFWSEDLSKAWSGVDLVELLGKGARQPSFDMGPRPKVEYAERIGWIPLDGDNYQKGEDGKYFMVTREMKERKEKVEGRDFENSSYAVFKDPTTGIHWIERQ